MRSRYTGGTNKPSCEHEPEMAEEEVFEWHIATGRKEHSAEVIEWHGCQRRNAKKEAPVQNERRIWKEDLMQPKFSAQDEVERRVWEESMLVELSPPDETQFAQDEVERRIWEESMQVELSPPDERHTWKEITQPKAFIQDEAERQIWQPTQSDLYAEDDNPIWVEVTQAKLPSRNRLSWVEAVPPTPSGREEKGKPELKEAKCFPESGERSSEVISPFKRTLQATSSAEVWRLRAAEQVLKGRIERKQLARALFPTLLGRDCDPAKPCARAKFGYDLPASVLTALPSAGFKLA
eukprot:TRINITY_DN3404_c0_g1_i2.p1 TRINITY_DN3404_c0_g1~~TRINITY_DN3404_c0_g1_i2.p1  ORF type:complete len:294 (+),score=61.92 TRINITY_DN3404_c0_g1_i2:130-1011(+)